MTRPIHDAEITQLRDVMQPFANFACGCGECYNCRIKAALSLLDTIAARTQEPVAWMHDAPGRRDVIHSDVKQLLERVDTDYLHRKIYKAEHYTIPLYTHPQPAAVPDGWQPIETAPTEWGSYLVWHPKYGMETLWWQLKDGGRDGRKAGHWYSEDDNYDDSEMDWRVAYWMPLPAAPKEATK